MQRRFFDSFNHTGQSEKYNGKTLIKRQIFLSKAADVMKDVIASIIFIAIFDLTIIGIIALANRPLLNLIFGN